MIDDRDTLIASQQLEIQNLKKEISGLEENIEHLKNERDTLYTPRDGWITCSHYNFDEALSNIGNPDWPNGWTDECIFGLRIGKRISSGEISPNMVLMARDRASDNEDSLYHGIFKAMCKELINEVTNEQ